MITHTFDFEQTAGRLRWLPCRDGVVKALIKVG